MRGLEAKVGRGGGQRLPDRAEKGIGVRSEEAPRRRDEPALGQLDALGQRHVGGGRGGRGQRLEQHGKRHLVGVARVLLTEATQARLGAPDIAADEPDHDLADQERVTAVDEEVELSPGGRMVRGRGRQRRPGRSLPAQETDSSQRLPSRTAGRRNRMPWLSAGFIQSMRSKTRAASSLRPSRQRQRP